METIETKTSIRRKEVERLVSLQGPLLAHLQGAPELLFVATILLEGQLRFKRGLLELRPGQPLVIALDVDRRGKRLGASVLNLAQNLIDLRIVDAEPEMQVRGPVCLLQGFQDPSLWLEAPRDPRYAPHVDDVFCNVKTGRQGRRVVAVEHDGARKGSVSFVRSQTKNPKKVYVVARTDWDKYIRRSKVDSKGAP